MLQLSKLWTALRLPADARQTSGPKSLSPRSMIIWRSPAQSADRRFGIGNAEELGDTVRDETLDRSFFRFNNSAQFLFGSLIWPGGPFQAMKRIALRARRQRS